MELHLNFNIGMLVTFFFMYALQFLTCTSLPPSPSNATDRLALLSFKASIADDPTGVLSSWNDTLHYCLWTGVTCGRLHPERVTALDLDSRGLAGTISPLIANLTFLRRLHLSNNQLHGNIPQDIGHLSRLQYFNLSYNSLDGEIPASLTQCLDLRCICLGANQLEGRIPSNLSNLTELQIISLRANQLHGEIPTEISTLPKLVRLILGTNNLTGGIPPSLGNLSTLSILDVAANNLEGNIPSTLGRISGLGAFQICINNLSGTIPPSIYNLSSIWYFHVATNKLSGTLPPNIGLAFPRLQYLLMYQNQFEGLIPASLSNASSLVKIELASNRFTGPIPSGLGVLQDLIEVLLASNRLEDGEANGWSFLASLTNCTNLQIIDLYDNKIRGKFPSSIANLSAGLQKLSMNKNQISGRIPPGIGNLIGLTSLHLEENLLTGAIPDTIGKLQMLHVLDLSSNGISGNIPFSIGNLTLLTGLTLDDCDLVGSIPRSFGNLKDLEFLDLSSNKLTGPIPKEVVSLSSLSIYLGLYNNLLNGSLPVEVGNLKNIELIDVSGNKLSGQIPSTLSECQILVYLYMEDNNLQGTIPQTLSNLKGMQALDLSSNNLSGAIPEFLERLQNFQYLNLSFNNFEGEVPKGGIFRNMSAVSLQGNRELCGGNPGLHLGACPSLATKRRHRISTHNVVILVVCLVLGLIIVFLLLACCYWLRRSTPKFMSMPSSKDPFPKVSFSELLKATGGFSSANLIGAGGFGSVYKGIMGEEEKVVAVKVLNLQQKGATKSFMAECRALRKVRHRNLIKILTACSSVDYKGNSFKALVFEFMPNGNLENWLHPKLHENGQSHKLSFIQRLNIAIDVASALDYLHHHGPTPIVHCDLKPSNVLLDSDKNAHVGDFGLARFLSQTTSKPLENESSSTGIKGTIGYVAPEYGMGSQISTQGDIYSYGVLLLEMFTGKRPTDEAFKESMNLHKFAEMAFLDNVLNIVDETLLLEEGNGDGDRHFNDSSPASHVRDCLVSVIRVGLSCSKQLPTERMSMDAVLRELSTCRGAFLGGKGPISQRL